MADTDQPRAARRAGRWRRAWALAAGLAGLVGLAGALPAQAQTVRYFWSTPEVLSAEGPASLRYEVEIQGTPSRVVFEFDPGDKGSFTDHEMRDDGSGGDRVAGDGIWTVTLPTAPLLAAHRPELGQRVFMGFVNVYSGTRSVYRGFHLAMVGGAALGAWPVTRRSDTAQHTTHVANVVVPSYFGELLPDRATREFYRWFGDDYDFLSLVYLPSRHDNRTYSTVRMAISGLGRTPRDNSALMGSKGRLLGYVQFPLAALFDGASEALSHELGHHWISGLDFDPLGQGIPHWPYSTMGTGIMGISIGGRNGQGGIFACDIQDQGGRLLLGKRSTPRTFNDLDLYLMGLMAPEEVGAQWVFDDQAAAGSLGCNGQSYSGGTTRLTAQDVVAKAGPRSPSHLQAPRRFRMATVLVSRDGLASPQAMAYFSAMAQRAELRETGQLLEGRVVTPSNPFYAATLGRATLHTHLTQDTGAVLRAAASGPLKARRLTGTVEPAPADVGATRQLFVAALVGSGWYFRTAAGWQAYAGGDYPAYATQALTAAVTVPILDGALDLSALAGTRIYMGYGQSAAEMLSAGRYALVHVLQ